MVRTADWPRNVKLSIFVFQVVAILLLAGQVVRAATARAWGDNQYGEIGDGTMSNRYSPVAVSGFANGVTIIAAGLNHSLAVQNGALYAWGDNAASQIGDGTTTNRLTPWPVAFLNSGVTAIAGGSDYSLAVQNGALYAWGDNGSGRLGD